MANEYLQLASLSTFSVFSQWISHMHLKVPYLKQNSWGFPGGAVVKNPPANAGDTGSSPGLGGSHMPRSN